MCAKNLEVYGSQILVDDWVCVPHDSDFIGELGDTTLKSGLRKVLSVVTIKDAGVTVVFESADKVAVYTERELTKVFRDTGARAIQGEEPTAVKLAKRASEETSAPSTPSIGVDLLDVVEWNAVANAG